MRRALILGGADCVWVDLAGVERLIGRAWPWDVIAINDVGCHWVRDLPHWCSLHPEKFRRRDRDSGDKIPWVDLREQNGHPPAGILWARRGVPKHADRLAHPWGGGSSGLLAVSIALDKLGADRVVLCGVPMQRRPHFAESHTHHGKGAWAGWKAHWRAWTKKQNVERMKGRVRSMSGRTRDLLGEPTREWLEGSHDDDT